MSDAKKLEELHQGHLNELTGHVKDALSIVDRSLQPFAEFTPHARERDKMRAVAFELVLQELLWTDHA